MEVCLRFCSFFTRDTDWVGASFIDLCNEHAVTGYPQMNLYKHGNYVEKFTGSRDWDRIVNFIDGHREKLEDDLPDELPKTSKPDESSQQRSSPSKWNKDGLVVSLDPNRFNEVIKEGPVFVKFFAPWYVSWFS